MYRSARVLFFRRKHRYAYGDSHRDTPRRAPEPGSDGSQCSRTGGGRVHGAALHLDLGRVRLKLEQGGVAGETAVDAEDFDGNGLAYRLDDVGHPPGDRLQRGAGDMGRTAP